MLSTKFTKLLNVRHPVICTPMAHTSGGALAAAVTNAGGFGFIGGGYGDTDFIKRELEVLMSKSGASKKNKPRFGVGFITWGLQNKPQALDMVLEAKPDAIWFSFGDARAFIQKARQALPNVLIFNQVQTMKQVHEILPFTDVLVVQGMEAGGHGHLQGRTSLGFTPAAVDAVRGYVLKNTKNGKGDKDQISVEFPGARSANQAGGIPVLVAGGIADGRGLAAALVLGADGVSMGTRFSVSNESLLADSAKESLIGRSGDDTIRSTVFDYLRGPVWPSPFDGRAIRNRWTEQYGSYPTALISSPSALADARAAFQQAASSRDEEPPLVWAGEGIDLITSKEPAGTIVTKIVEQAATVLNVVPSEVVKDNK